MNIQKAYWTTDGDNVRISMPLQKVDKENRIVSGFATLDNIDTSDDIVLASASQSAFANFRGNIRLMHQPIPAGKLMNFREENYYDSKTQKFYNGIYVDVYVSKGAPDIWEMCLDGTLTGFSIGGQVREAETQFVKDAGKAVRFIKAYDLIELSLVDSPANQLCDIFSIQKSSDGTTTVSGMLTEVVAENVFWCAKDEVAYTSVDAEKACTACGGTTENIGWFESDGGDKTQKVNALVAEFTKTDSVEGRLTKMAEDITVSEELEVEAQNEPTELVVDGEGPTTGSGEALGDDTEAEHAAAVEDTEEAGAELVDAEDEDDADDEFVGKAANEDDPDNDGDDDSSEEGDDDDDADKKDVKKVYEELTDAIEVQLTKFADRLAAIEAAVSGVEELKGSVAQLTEKFASISSDVDGVKKSFDAVEKGVGLKKSGDLGGSTEDKVEKSTKSLWNGRFFGSVGNL